MRARIIRERLPVLHWKSCPTWTMDNGPPLSCVFSHKIMLRFEEIPLPTLADYLYWSAVPRSVSVCSGTCQKGILLNFSLTAKHPFDLCINSFIYTVAGLGCSRRSPSSSCWIHCWQWKAWVGSQSLHLPWPSTLTKHDTFCNHTDIMIEIIYTFITMIKIYI